MGERAGRIAEVKRDTGRKPAATAEMAALLKSPERGIREQRIAAPREAAVPRLVLHALRNRLYG
jgi:hypothetical protein